jgi:predicted dehydrogenase
MGERHAQILRATPGAKVTCVLDRDLERAARIAGTAVVCETFDEVLHRADVDGVVIALPTSLHVPFGIRAAKAGKHVVTEKPISMDVASGRCLVDECAKTGVVCAVISQNRFSDGNAALSDALKRNELGKPVLARASVKWFRHDEYYTGSDWRGRMEGEGGGVLMNQAVHSLDLLLWMFGKPRAIAGMTHGNRSVIQTEDVGVAILRFEHGVLATFEATTSAFPGFEERIEVHGPEASCVVEKGNMICWRQKDDHPAPPPPHFAPPTQDLNSKFTLFQRQYRNILAAIRKEEELVVKPEEAIDVIEATLAIYANQPGTLSPG